MHFVNVFLFEINEINQKVLLSKGYNLAGFDFLQCANKDYFTKIIANPPFAKNQDIIHIRKMYDCLTVGGRIVSVLSKHWQYCNNKKEMEFKNWLGTLSDYDIEEIPENTFKESGTSVAACLITINK